jgi:threonine synthase
MFAGCPRCRAQGVAVNLTVEYDLAPLAGVTPATFAPGAGGMWRFRDLLPLRSARPVTLGEGGTPLVHLERLGARLGLPRLYAKDESRNPTWSYKDRLCATAVSHAVAIGARVITISSTGNHGASTAAYAARAGLPCVIFTMTSVPDTMKTLMQAYGAAVVACPTAEARWELMRQGVERLGWYPTSGFVMPPVGSNPWGIEGYKTIAYEVAESLEWTAPDVVVVPSAYSDGLYGIWKGWTELHQLGLVKSPPRMIAAEPFGPLAAALERGLDAPEPVQVPGPSIAFSIATPYGRRRCARDRRGHLRGAARARARGGAVRRALVGDRGHRRHAARQPPRARSGEHDRRRAHLGRPQGSRRQPRVAAGPARGRRRLRSRARHPA